MCVRIYVDIETVPPDEKRKSDLKIEVLRRLMRDFPTVTKRVDKTTEDAKFGTKLVEDSVTGRTDSDDQCSDEMFRRLALHAEFGRILCIGVIVEKQGAEVRKGVFGFNEETQKLHMDECKTLRGFWKLLKAEFNPRSDLVIGHNLLDFDLPFIYKRSRINNIRPSVQLNFARYRSAPIYDTMKEWSLWNLRENSISLSVLAELLEVDMKKTEGIDGSKVYDAFLGGEDSLIAKYCLQDVELTRAVYKRVTLLED